MPIQFSPEQQKVIETRDKNILVSAAAGSGKTAVLVERIVQMVCDEAHPVDIDRLLVVTFTNAAAAEMRERIARGLSDKLMEKPESAHIQRQSILLHNALITTIDSFSLFIVRNHFNEIGLDPAFRVADEGELKLLEQDAMAELLEDRFEKKEEGFVNCVEFFCPGGREKVLEDHIRNLSRYASSFPWPKEWLLARKEDYSAQSEEECLKSVYGKYMFAYIREVLAGCLEKLKKAYAVCMEPDGPYMYAELLEKEISQFEAAFERGTDAFDSTLLEGFAFGRLPSKKDEGVSAIKRELVKKIRGDVKDFIKDLEVKFFETPLSLALFQGHECAKYVSELIGLVIEFDERMQEKKRERKLVSFADMEHFCLDILLKRDGEKKRTMPTSVAEEYRQYFAEVLIDEYQDSNLVQEYILSAVSGEEEGRYNRFMVGDVKQSIYKFRLARPELFMEKYEAYQEEGDCIRIDLSRNYRSRKRVLDSVNGIFSQVMDKRCGGVEYDDRAKLYLGAAYEEEDNEEFETELLLVEKTEDEDAKVLEARAIADRIKKLRTSFQVTDKADGKLRAVKYSDIVILLRTNAGWDEEFRKVLEDEGIPAYITSKTGYFSAIEVQDLLQFLRILDNPHQDIPLFCVMKGVFGNFDEEEIAILRGENNNCSLYEAICRIACTEEGDEEQREEGERKGGLSEGSFSEGNFSEGSFSEGMHLDEKVIERRRLIEKCGAFLENIAKYREYTVYMPIRELLQRIVDDYDYMDYVSALPAGSKRRANVEMLFSRASDFEKTSYFGLFHFVRYIEQLEKYDVDFGEADKLDENADVVRIMSIHKSKGLEFPVAFVAGLSKRFNMQDTNQSVIVDMEMGLACDFVDLERRIRNKTLRKRIISTKMKEDNLSEELRVLYVALTRAKEKLIMTASVEKPEEVWEMHQCMEGGKLSFADFMQAGSYLDFILPVAKKAGIKTEVRTKGDLETAENAEQIHMLDKKEKLERADEFCDREALQALETRFSFEYPFEGMKGLYTKTTVSELKIAAMASRDEAAYHSFEEREVVPFIPVFKRGEEKIQGTVRGNAFHRAMELLDFDYLFRDFFEEMPENYEAFYQGADRGMLLDRLHKFLLGETESLRLSKEYFAALNEGKILNFLLNEIGYRMWKADRQGKLYREQPFVLGIDAKRLMDNIPDGEKVLIQGIIDAFFEEDGQIVLLDYKTDIIESMQALKIRYETQLEYYGEALEKLTGLPVKEKLLYSFYLEKCAG